MGTKSHYRNDKLRFYGAPMFTSVASMTTNIRKIGATITTEEVLVSEPVWAGTLSTEKNMNFRVVAGGILSSSSQYCDFSLCWGSTEIANVRAFNAKVKEAYKPWHCEWVGRFANIQTSSGQITAVGKVTVGFSTPKIYMGATTGSTAQGVKFATTNLALKAASTLGLNLTADFHSTAGGVGTTPAITCNYGYIQYFSG